MATPHTDIEKMIQELNQFILPSTLMECFDAYREEKYKEAIKTIPEATLAWFLDMLNRYRGPEDKKGCLLEVFDPSMYTENHPAWEGPPGTVIELPALTSEVAALAEKESELADVAQEEILKFRIQADTYDDKELLQLGEIAKTGRRMKKQSFTSATKSFDIWH